MSLNRSSKHQMKKSHSSGCHSSRIMEPPPPPPTSSSSNRNNSSTYLNGYIPPHSSSPVGGIRNTFKPSSESKVYYWSSLTSNAAKEPLIGRPPLYDETSLSPNAINSTLPTPPNFRLNFVKNMEDSLILRLPQGSCDTTPDTPDSLDDDSVDQTSLPPTPLPIPVSDLPLPKPPPTQDFKTVNSPDPWLMKDNLIEEISAPPNAVCSSASSPATPICSPQAQTRKLLRSISQIRLHNTQNNQQSLLHHKHFSVDKSNEELPSKGPLKVTLTRVYSSLYPQMVTSNTANFEKNDSGAKNDPNNNYDQDNSMETLENRTHKTQTYLTTTTTTTTTKVIESSPEEEHNLKSRKKPPPASTRYATIGTSKMKRSAIVNNNNRIINANLSSSTLHCTTTSSGVQDTLPLQPPPYQDPPKYRKPRTTISMENNPPNSSSSCFTIDSAMNSINNNHGLSTVDSIPTGMVGETQNAILKDLQRHMSYELLENPRHLTSEEEDDEEEEKNGNNHVEADVRVTSTTMLQIKSKSLPTIARVQQQNQLTNGHCYKLGSMEKMPVEVHGGDAIQKRLRNDSLSTLNEVNSSKIANLSSGSSSMINKLRSDTNRNDFDVLQRNNIDLDRGGAVKPGRSRVDSIVDRDLLDEKEEKKRKLHNGNLVSKEPESSRLTSTDDDFETTDDEHHRSHNHHRKYRRKRSSISHPDSIEETEDDDEDNDPDCETEDPEMEMCDPCQCYGKCCLDMVASIFCVSLL